MKLEKIQQIGSTDRLELRFDDGTVLKTPSFLAADFGLYPGAEVSEEQLASIKAAIGKQTAKERAVRILASASVSERELQKRLVQKGQSRQDASEAVEWLRDLSLLDDRTTAAQLVRSAAAKGYGRARVRSILFEKGIPRELWDEALEQMPEMDEAIDGFLKKHLDGRMPDDKLIKRTIDALLRRGHSLSEIRAGLQRYRQGLGDELDLEDME